MSSRLFALSAGTVGTAAAGAAAVALLGLATPASADEVQSTWTGAIDQSWINPLNWSPSTFFPNNGAGGDTYLVSIDDMPGTDSLVELEDDVTIDGLSLDLGDALFVLNTGALRLAGDATNDGLISVTSTANLTQMLVVTPEVTLGGTGELRLGGSALDRVSGTTFNFRLTNGPDHAIRGGGLLGTNVIIVENEGTIEATDGLSLFMDSGSGADASNTGLLGATGSGTLILQSATIDNTGGLVQADAGSEVRLEGPTLLGGDFNTIGDGQITVGLGNAVIESARNLGFIEIENSRQLNLAGTITNDGVIRTFSDSGISQVLVASDPLILQGDGEILMNGADPNLDRVSGTTFNFVLEQGPDHRIRGAGSLGVNVINIVNEGLIEASFPVAPMIIDPNATLVNTGTIRASEDSVVQLRTGTYENTGGLIETVGGQILLQGATIVGGDLDSSSGGIVAVGLGNARLADVRTVGSVSVENTRTLDIEGTLQNEALIQTAATENLTQVRIVSSTTTVRGPGEIRLGGDDTLDRLTGITFNFELVQEAPHAIRGAGGLGVNVINVNNQSLIEADVPGGTLSVDPNTVFVNTGALRAVDGGIVALLGGTYENLGGLIEAADGSEVQLRAPTIFGGDLASAGSGRFVVGLGNATLGDLRLTGTLDIADQRLLGVEGTLVNDGIIRTNSKAGLSQLSVLSPETTLAGTGELRLGGSTLDRVTGSTFNYLLINDVDHAIRGGGGLGQNVVNVLNRGTIEADNPDGALSIDANSTLENTGRMAVLDSCAMTILPSAFTQAGDLIVATGGTLDRNGAITQTGGTTLIDGMMTLTSGPLDIQDGSLRGRGMIAGDVVNGGFVQPGADADFAIGTLTVDGDYDQSSTGTLFIQIDETGNDRLDVTGVADLGGSLLVGFDKNFVPTSGTQYVIVTADEIQPPFIFANCPVGYVIDYGDTEVTITITEGISIADLDCNGVVDFNDLLLLLPAFGPCPGGGVPCRADVDASGEVDFNDLLILLSAWS